jgi:Amt family ammonium transporter
MKLGKLSVCLLTLSAVSTNTLVALAQEQATTDRLTKLETAAATAQSGADNAWMLVSAALVLMMTGPGLALFYCGLVRKKNVLATMAQSFVLMAVVTILWAFFGYSIAFSEGTPFFGKLNYLFLNGVGSAPNPDYAATIPQQTFMLFQLMFAIITPALITGAFAERIKFNAMLAFTSLWVTFIYFPLAHQVWGKGGFMNAALGGRVESDWTIERGSECRSDPRFSKEPFRPIRVTKWRETSHSFPPVGYVSSPHATSSAGVAERSKDSNCPFK